MRLNYGAVQARIAAMPAPALSAFIRQGLEQSLSDLWCSAYAGQCPRAEVVEVGVATFTYLFDLAEERCIAAYGVMGGVNKLPRDRSRMAGHPKAEGRDYHRGHMIPHTGHGGTDINLFVQRGSVNIGPFRELEKLAVTNSGSFYFVRLDYAPAARTQRPIAVEQGLLLDQVPGKLELRFFPN